jgi:predicted RNA polymerase sigma factor
MRVIVLVKASKESEAGLMPTREILEARTELTRAASLTRNARERELLRERAAACTRGAG